MCAAETARAARGTDCAVPVCLKGVINQGPARAPAPGGRPHHRPLALLNSELNRLNLPATAVAGTKAFRNLNPGLRGESASL